MNGVDGPARHALRQPIIGDRSEEVSRLEAIVTDLLEDEPQDVVERITTKLRGYVHSEEIPG